MVIKGIVLRHKISTVGLEVDQAKVFVIETLMPPNTVKGIRMFLGHAGFYKRFIKDFSKIFRPLCRLLEKDTVTPRFSVRPDWRIRTEFGVRDHILGFFF